MRKVIALIPLLISLSASAAVEELHSAKTPRGAMIEVLATFPSGDGQFPAVVIAPGAGYHMRLPLLEQLAHKIAEKGYVAIRMNWNYHSVGAKPSKGLVDELEDFTTAVSFAKEDPRIDSDKIVVAGKSLGTAVAYRTFDSEPSINSLFLLTPLCTWHWDDEGNQLDEPIATGSKNYPNLVKSVRPVVVLIGNNDPNCTIPMLYNFLKDSKGNIATVVVEGDHSLNVGPFDDPAYEERNSRNILAATEIMAHWVELLFGNEGSLKND